MAQPKSASASARSAFLLRALRVGVSILVIATLASALGRYHWLLDLFVHFKMQYGVLFGVCALASVWARSRWLTLICIAGCGFHAWPVLAFACGHPDKPFDGPATSFRIASYNAGFWNDNYRQIGAFLESTRADAIVLLEYDNDQIDRLAPFIRSYRFRSSSQADLRFGAAILSRWPMNHEQGIELAPGGAAAAYAQIRTNTQFIDLVGVHLNWPATPRSSRLREQELHTLSALLENCKRTCVVAGDFNLTQWSTHFRDFQARVGWNNCAYGQGLPATWPDQIPPLRIQIDQCLTPPGVFVKRFVTGPGMGSDHLPMVVDLAVEETPD